MESEKKETWIPDSVATALDGMTDERKSECFEKYCTVISRHIAKARLKQKEKLFLPLHTIKTEVGQRRLNGKLVWLFHLLHKAHPYFYVIEPGSNLKGKISEVGVIASRQHELEERHTMTDIAFENIDPTELPTVPVCLDSIRGYVRHTDRLIARAYGAKKETMKRNVREAVKLLHVIDGLIDEGYAEFRGDRFLFPYQTKKSPFGRSYHCGVNLQSVPRIVREAALGHCYSYDINSAVITFKLHLVQKIFDIDGYDVQTTFPSTLTYLCSKDSVRERLASKLLPNKDNVRMVKQLVTSISFGATLNEAAWKDDSEVCFSSFREIVRIADDRAVLKDDEWLVGFELEQRSMTEMIVRWAEKSLPELLPFDIESARNKRGKWKYAKVMAYIYQTLETILMERVCETFQENILLTVHDGFYTDRKIDPWLLNEVCEEFTRAVGKNTDPRTAIRFGVEAISSYRFDEFDEEEREHQRRIATEATRARGYTHHTEKVYGRSVGGA